MVHILYNIGDSGVVLWFGNWNRHCVGLLYGSKPNLIHEMSSSAMNTAPSLGSLVIHIEDQDHNSHMEAEERLHTLTCERYSMNYNNIKCTLHDLLT